MNESVVKRVRITSIESLTDKSKRFVLEPLDGWKPVYEAGQYLTFIFPHLDGEKRRSYSITSSPATDEPLAIAIKKIDNGEFSRMMVYNARAGDVLDTAGIQGLFTLPSRKEKNDYIFLAAGSGITPCLSLIKTLLLTTSERIVLIYSNSSVTDAMFLAELDILKDRSDGRFTVRLLFSDRFVISESRLSKSLLEQLLVTYLRPGKPTQFYLCGPELYMLMIGITIRSAGISEEYIHREDFDTRPRLFKPKPPDTNAHEVILNINGNGTSLSVQYPDTILAAAKKNGMVLPYSCEAGRCGACIARCRSGKIWMAYNEILTDEEIRKGWILTCQSYPIEQNAEILIKIS